MFITFREIGLCSWSSTSTLNKLPVPMNTEVELRVCTYSILKNDFILLVVLLPKHYTKLIEEITGYHPPQLSSSSLSWLIFKMLFLRHKAQFILEGAPTDICSALVAETFFLWRKFSHCEHEILKILYLPHLYLLKMNIDHKFLK